MIGLYDCPRSGRPTRFTEDEKATFLSYIDENPHQAKAAAARLLEETGKEASFDTFKRVLKKKPTFGNAADNQSRENAMRQTSKETRNIWNH